MHPTPKATIDSNGHFRLSESIQLDAPRRALVTILEEPAWSHLRSDR